jgi:hypothetical protein
MTDWKTRALAAEQTIADAKHELESFYEISVPIESAIAALHRLKALLGVETKRAYGVPESLTVETDYRLDMVDRS